MSNDLTDSIPTKSELAPNFTVDVINTSVSVFVVIAIWFIFLQVVYPFLYLSFGFIGLIGSMLLMMILLSYSFSKGSDLLSVLAYQSASWRTGIPYMNPKTKCPYLERKWLTFSCRAEQLSEFDVPELPIKRFTLCIIHTVIIASSTFFLEMIRTGYNTVSADRLKFVLSFFESFERA